MPASRAASLADRLKARLRVVPDFPSPGIMFQDITPVLADAALLRELVEAMAAPWRDAGVTHVAAIESRGFIIGAPVAIELGAGFIPIRKPGKLPYRSVRQDYTLEYGSGRLEMHEDACPESSRVLVVDDVLATGGTARAACELVVGVGATVVGYAFFVSIRALEGQKRLDETPMRVLLSV